MKLASNMFNRIGQGGRVQTSIGRGCGRGRVQNLQHQPRQEDHIPPAPPEHGFALIRPPPLSVIRRPTIRPAPFGPSSRPALRPQLTDGTLDFRRDTPSPPLSNSSLTGLAELASMSKLSQNSTLSSSTHHSTTSSYAVGTSVGTTHNSPLSSTHPSTPSSASRNLPNVEMPYDPAPPLELTGERDVPWIRITIKNGRYVEYWESDDFKARSKIVSSNRQTEKGGPDTSMSKHTGGSIPFLVHEKQLSKELGRDCTAL
ncbi:hypothetical protein Sjap_017827 [Stephania japonica]|uniref:Uncharacterized protein n=1 Tax=Stephania japonica TaxID=461633 RepID=A0AAP0I6X7_9MAGN